MIRSVIRWGLIAAVAAGALGCPIDDEGGGGGFGTSTFSTGFIFIRADDRNVYAADQRGYSDIAQLTVNGNNKHATLSPDGRLVAYVHGEGGETELQTALLTGATPSTVLVSDAERSKFANPVFSPDGTQLAFSFEKGGASYIGLVGLDGQGFQSFGAGTLSYASPAFLDAGTLLVAAGSLSTGYTQLEKLDLATGAPQSVLNGLGAGAQAIRNRIVLSPDGKKVAFDGVTSSGATRIFVVDLATAALAQVTDHPAADATANDSFPTWVSGTQLGFSSDVGGNDQVYVVPATAQKQPGDLQLPSAVEPWFGPL